jgi:hypothetical protein
VLLTHTSPLFQELLDERETRVAEGTTKYIDWEIAKREILEAVK